MLALLCADERGKIILFNFDALDAQVYGDLSALFRLPTPVAGPVTFFAERVRCDPVGVSVPPSAQFNCVFAWRMV